MNPQDVACPHVATREERVRDPLSVFCNAAPGQPCRWAERFDGVTNPPFHAERIEAVLRQDGSAGGVDGEAFDRLILDTGLI